MYLTDSTLEWIAWSDGQWVVPDQRAELGAYEWPAPEISGWEFVDDSWQPGDVFMVIEYLANRVTSLDAASASVLYLN